MESDWIDYKCKSGQTIFIYNKVTGVHKWPPGFNNGSSEDSIIYGQPVEYKELRSIATQTDEYGCNNSCTSMYINTDPHHVSNILKTLPQPQPGVSVDGEHNLENEPDPENTLEHEDEQDQQKDLKNIFSIQDILNESFPPGNNLSRKTCQSKVDSAKKIQHFEREISSSNCSRKSWKCSSCEKQFRHQTSLIDHLRIHTGEKPFECSHCEKKFSKKAYLRVHARTHTGEKPYECVYCKKKFAQKAHLNGHQRQDGVNPPRCYYPIQIPKNDSGDKTFECTYCIKTFSQKDSLKAHVRTHTGEKPYECSFCAKTFSKKAYLRVHVRTHTGEKPFECSNCEKKFAQKTQLNSHLRVHFKEKLVA